MPSLHQLWKTFHSHAETQNRLRSAIARSIFHGKPSFSYNTSGEQFECSASSFKRLEVANLGRTLSITEAGSSTYATPSTHGSVWHSLPFNPCQVLLDKHQLTRSQQSLGWHNDILTVPQWKVKARLHSCSLDIPLERSSSARLWDHRSSLLGEAVTRIPDLNHVWSQTCNLADARDSEEKSELLSTSIAFHLMRFGLYRLPLVQVSLQRTVQAFKGDTSAALQAGLVLDCSSDKGNTDVSEKQREGSLSSTGLRLLSAACCLPHPEKQETGGEDAYFICPDKQVIGVADGVGGWADMGVDAGEYARQLMNQSLIAAQQEPAGCIDTVRVMEIAHAKTTCRGSSTACILALSNDGLRAANLGDSGFLVVRNGRLVFKSPAQQHNFNVPFQLENGGGDPPDAAEVFTVEVAVGDVIVAGTDGLFDNLYDTELVSIVVQATRSGLSPDITAKKIASLARERAQDCNRQTPFSAAAQDAGFRFYGGKMDDITVIVSFVIK